MVGNLNFEEAARLIVERAGQLVERLIRDRGHSKPPFLPEEFARLQGIKRIEKADLGERTGAVLLRLSDGYLIKMNVNDKQPLVRQNFSLAHEIGHILFGELKLERYMKTIEYRTFNSQTGVMAAARDMERLCDLAATELLMPRQVFKEYLSRFGVSVQSIGGLANAFGVSVETTVIRMAELSTDPGCVALLWRPWPQDNPKGLRLKWPRRSSVVPVNTYVRSPSTLHKAYEHDSPVKSYNLFKVHNTTKRLLVESKGFGRNETRKVVSLAFLDKR